MCTTFVLHWLKKEKEVSSSQNFYNDIKEMKDLHKLNEVMAITTCNLSNKLKVINVARQIILTTWNNHHTRLMECIFVCLSVRCQTKSKWYLLQSK